MLSLLFRVAAHCALLLFALRWNRYLERNRAALAEADVIVVMSSPRAFGTLYASLDETRRLFAGKKIAFIYHLEPVGQNPLLGIAVPDVTVIAVPRRRWDMKILGKPLELPPDDWHDPMSHAKTEAWIRRNGKSGAEVLNAFMLWRRLPVSAEAEQELPRVREIPSGERPAPYKTYSKIASAYAVGEFHVLNELHMYGAWNTLRSRQDVEPMALPESQRRQMQDALGAARGNRPAKLCGLHTRYGGDSDKTHRDGSPVEFYIPAIRTLVAAGYQVMIQGDRSFHRRFLDTFDGMVVDADLLGVDKNIFRLFCGCHADIFVGDWPVAPQLAASNGIPALVVNAWPVGWGVNGAQVYYRGIRGGDGRRWDAERTLRQGPLISCNTVPHAFPELFGNDDALIAEIAACDQIPLQEDEILNAVTTFLEDLESGAQETDRQAELNKLFPAWSPIAMATDCRLNRAWIDRYVEPAAACPGKPI